MKRSIISLMAGVGLAAGAVVFMNSQLQTSRVNLTADPAGPQLELGTIVIATEDLAFGSALRKELLNEVSWPAKSIPVEAFRSITDLLSSTESRVVLKSIVSGEPILKGKISGFGEKPTLSSKIMEGKRAFSIRINDVSGVAGFLLPGDRVDVMLTRKMDGADKDLATDVILQNIVVLGIDQLSDEESEQPVVAKTATVEVDPEQGQKLALAQQIGTLSLALRNNGTSGNVLTRRVSADDLTVLEREAGPSGSVVRVRRGAEEPETERVH